MKKKSKLLSWLRRPRGAGLVLLYLITVAAIVASVVLITVGTNETTEILSYFLFGLAAIALAYSVYTVVIYAPVIRQKGKAFLQKYRFTAKIMENYGFKTAVFALLSFAVTLAFTVMNTVSAVRYRSVWYGALAGYYAVLMLLRGCTVAAGRLSLNKPDRELREWRIYLADGACLIILEIAMAAAVTQLMLSGRPTETGQIMAIANAAYTFYKLAMAIRNLVKARKFQNPVTQALRNFGFADACMSVVSLTVLMLSTFSEGEELAVFLYLKATLGFAACAAIIAIASVMIIRADRHMKRLKAEATEQFEETEEIKDTEAEDERGEV